MPLIIDTYNVLHTVGVLPPELATMEVPGLIRLIQTSRHRDERTTLVCDGMPDPAAGERPVMRVGAMTIRYSGKGRTADDLIGQLISASTAPRRLTVVSSDHEVLRRARRRRCRMMTSEQFLGELADDAQIARPAAASPPAKPSTAMSEEQIDRWVKVFDLDERTLAIESKSKSKKSLSDDSNSIEAAASNEPAASSSPDVPPEGRDIPQIAPGEEVPDDIIAQAERIASQFEQSKPAPPSPEDDKSR